MTAGFIVGLPSHHLNQGHLCLHQARQMSARTQSLLPAFITFHIEVLAWIGPLSCLFRL